MESRAQACVMTDLAPRRIGAIASWHAHIYFDAATDAASRRLREWVEQRFAVEVGPWHAAPFGPHTTPSWYFGYTVAQFAEITSWLVLNRQGLRVLIHPNTDDPWADHAVHGLWLGGDQPVRLEGLSRSLAAVGAEPEQVSVNTRPSLPVEV